MNTGFADMILTGGTVITMEDPVKSYIRDIAVSGSKIMAIGSSEEILVLKSEETKIVDVVGNTIMPGLIDCHNHMTSYGHNLGYVDLSPSIVKNISQLLECLKSRASETNFGEWIKAWALDETKLEEKRYPTLKELDEACPNHPVSIKRTCGHVLIVNSRAMKEAGIKSDSPNPHGGELVRDANGHPSGILYELAAMNLVNNIISYPTPEECANALALSSIVYASEGLTTVSEAGAGWTGNPNEVAGFQIAWQRDQLMPRVCMGLMESTYSLFPKDRGTGLFTGFGDDELRIGAIKFVADGGIGARTACTSRPYEETDYCGVLAEEHESLRQRMEVAHNAGYQISVHAIGDKTIEMVLDIYEDILLKYPKVNHRHRIEHVAMSRPDLLDRMSKLNLIAVVQPGFIYYFGDSWISNIGLERFKNTIPLKTMIQKGIMVAGSSDRPVTDGNPWPIIWSAVNRQTFDGKSVCSEECISIEDALKLYTVNGAYTHFAEDRLGTLSPGKYADMIVLDADPLSIDPANIKDIKVQRTFVGGKEVFKRR